MGISTLPLGGGSSYSLRETIVSSGSVTLPSNSSFVYAVLTDGTYTAAGWVPGSATCTIGTPSRYSIMSVPSSATLYIYY